ncbi:unnamed protein product [Rotaria sordida]|uniref:Uncharacterized protein n=1 Tax=Rotaria sordida TaxID=392033 RepID=A0A815W1M6_9BILA|nr:unnamed protein product [Rotaria sordida]CAF1536208.1 unnamed protein product [Rotaria sordida]
MDSTQFTMNAIIIGLSLSNDYFLTYIFINELGSDNERSNEVSILAKHKNLKGKNNSNEHIERLYSHKIKSRTLELNVIVDGKSASYLQPG